MLTVEYEFLQDIPREKKLEQCSASAATQTGELSVEENHQLWCKDQELTAEWLKLHAELEKINKRLNEDDPFDSHYEFLQRYYDAKFLKDEAEEEEEDFEIAQFLQTPDRNTPDTDDTGPEEEQCCAPNPSSPIIS